MTAHQCLRLYKLNTTIGSLKKKCETYTDFLLFSRLKNVYILFEIFFSLILWCRGEDEDAEEEKCVVYSNFMYNNMILHNCKSMAVGILLLHHFFNTISNSQQNIMWRNNWHGYIVMKVIASRGKKDKADGENKNKKKTPGNKEKFINLSVLSAYTLSHFCTLESHTRLWHGRDKFTLLVVIIIENKVRKERN